MPSVVQQLVEAGIVDTSFLTDDDLAVLQELTQQEVNVLIQVATRLYPDARSLLKTHDLKAGAVRLCVPL
ncbi:MAG: aroma-sacti cluster domain-containing protein [Vicinamibacterales bacterium]